MDGSKKESEVSEAKMNIELTIKYNPTTDACSVAGIPIVQLPDRSRVAHVGLSLAALARAAEVIKSYKPPQTDLVLPPVSGANGSR